MEGELQQRWNGCMTFGLGACFLREGRQFSVPSEGPSQLGCNASVQGGVKTMSLHEPHLNHNVLFLSRSFPSKRDSSKSTLSGAITINSHNTLHVNDSGVTCGFLSCLVASCSFQETV